MRQYKTLLAVDPHTGQRTELGRLWMDDNRLASRWSGARGESWRAALEEAGVVLASGTKVFPADGRRFYDALDAAFARSTLVVLEVHGG